MRALVLLGSLVASAAVAQEVELFVDRGDTFLRAGSASGLAVGTTVTVLGDKIAKTEERRRVGTATVMEVWPSLARVALDDAARADKGAKKFVSLGPAKAPAVQPAQPPPPPPAADPGRKPQGAVPPPAPAGNTAGGALKGHATFKGAGPWKLLGLYNDENFPWTNCLLSLPGNLTYRLRSLRANDRESIALSNFQQQGPEIDTPQTSVTVKCAEGQARFVFPD